METRTSAKIRPSDGCYLTGRGEQGAGNEYRDPESKKWEQNRELEMKLLIGLTARVQGRTPMILR